MEFSLGLLSRFVGQLRDRMQLAKLTLCFQVALSSLFGFIYAAQAFSLRAVLVSFAVLILACGAVPIRNGVGMPLCSVPGIAP